MVRGTLADHVHRKKDNGNSSPLSWVQRLKICIGAARGLDYLHTGTAILKRVIHLDVKSSNILLDENWAAKISDFGLSRFGPAEQECTHVSTTHIKGTAGYIDPDYLFTRRFTKKSDVYAFGVVLLEVLCERPAMDRSLDEDQWGLAGWGQQCIKDGASHQIIGPNLKREILPNSFTEFVQIADQCLQSRPKQRPTMSEVVARLEHALALQLHSNLVVEEYLSDTCLPVNNHENAVSYQEDDHIGKVIQLGDSKSKQFSAVGAPVVLGKSIPFIVKLIDKVLKLGNSISKSKKFSPVGAPVVLEYPEFHPGQLKRFSLHELQVATDNFSNRNILRRGGFGDVYKGRLADGTLVALKRRKEEHTPVGECMFLTEVKIKSVAEHRNVLRLLGFCMTSTERVLVYPFMANGSVASCLRGKQVSDKYSSITRLVCSCNANVIKMSGSELQSPLDWPKRKQIALGSARALVYLHNHCKPNIIHRDIKAANILLDWDFEAVIGDFGLAKPIEMYTNDTTDVRGTIGHMAPEYLSTGKCSEKIDVFGYGVMLLELITGQRAFDPARHAGVMLLDWVKGCMKEKKLETLVDANLNGNYIDNEVVDLIKVALFCTLDFPTDRPRMSDVVRMLKELFAQDMGIVAKG